MNFRCLGDTVDPEQYLLRDHYTNKSDIEIPNLKRLLRDKNSKYNKLKLANEELRRENEQLKSQKQTIEERNNSLESDLHNLAQQTRIKISELHNETQHIQDCYNKLKMDYNQIKTIVKQKDNTIKILLPYREQCKLLIIKLDEMNKMYKRNEELYKKQIILLKDKDEEKQIKKLPTIQETLWKYNDIRDETYTDTVTFLKGFICRNNELKLENNKWYIDQVSHEIMFNILIQCYVSTKTYIEKHKQFNINNYLNEIQIDIIKTLKDKCNKYYHKNIALNIFNLKSNGTEMNEINEIIKYINKCCSICWIMVFQNLKFYPSMWRDNNQFNQSIHTRVFGSNVKCQKILYNVWPVIINSNDNIIGNQKIDVVTQTNLYKPK